MSDVPEDSFSSTSALLFAIVSFVLYWWFLRPTAPTETATAPATTPRRTPARRPPAPQWNPPNAPPNNTAKALSEAAAEVLSSCQHQPPHVSTSDVGLGGSNVLNDGLVVFSHTKASTAATNAATSRPDRAKILTRLVCKTPPSKGSTVVVAISQVQLEASSRVPQVLSVLATFYNVLVIVGVNDTAAWDRSQVLQALDAVSEQVLPRHRILLASSVTGRVALVRQLNKVSLVMDWDTEVETQLQRFGYQVALVDDWNQLLD